MTRAAHRTAQSTRATATFTIGGEFVWSKLAIRAEDVPDLKAVQFRIVTRLDF